MKSLLYLFAFALCSLTACDKTNDVQNFAIDETVSGFEAPAKAHSDEPKGKEEQDKVDEMTVTDRKIVRNGEVRFETEDLISTRLRVSQAAIKHGGYVSNENEYKSDETLETRYTLRVPSDKFEAVLNDISTGVNRFDTRRIDAQDVTEEYIDLQARINTKKALVTRYQELLAKATTVESILAIEKQIGELQTEIESAEGRLRYLSNRVTYATLSVEVYQRIASPIGFGSKFSSAFVSGWHSLLYFTLGVFSIWPFVLMAVVGVLLMLRVRRRLSVKPSV